MGTDIEVKGTAEVSVGGQAIRSLYNSDSRGGRYFLGIDVGSTSSDVVVVDDGARIIFSDYKRTQGRPLDVVKEQLEQAFNSVGWTNIGMFYATGSGGRFLSKLTGMEFVNEVPAQAAGVTNLYPHLKIGTIIEMGGQDSKLIFLSSKNGQVEVRDFALNSVCAAGTGSFLDQQASRLGIDIEQDFGRLACESKNVPRMAGRCSVFAKSDMIHLQQQATAVHDIIAGLCQALARNLKSNLGCGREFVKPIVFTGGVAANAGVVNAFEKVLELSPGLLLVPEEHFYTGAIGAVIIGRNRSAETVYGIDILKRIDQYLCNRGSLEKSFARRDPLVRPTQPVPKSRVYEELLDSKKIIDAYLGVDVGSISTNVVVMNQQKQVLAKAYLMTAGRPLEAVRRGLKIVGKNVNGKVRILGAGTTGSGRYLTGDFIGADVVINEITAQAAGTKIVNPQVDTIFEIGGQDSKYISLENGVVVDFEMNHACAAGTGSFLEEQAERLGINIKDEFAEFAFRSGGPIKLGERCTVFMETDLLSYYQQGAKTTDLVAGLSYSIAANYLNRVVGRRRIGNHICFQGGTAFNKAVVSAFEKITGKSIMVPDHHEVTGALGAASITAERMKANSNKRLEVRSGFRGFENLVKTEYSVESFRCEHCANHCEIKKVELAGSEPLYYGSRCDRYNLKKKQQAKIDFDAFSYRNEMMFKYAQLKKDIQAGKRGTIGIPLALINWRLLPLFSAFFKSVGFEVVVSGQTDKQTIRKGVERVNSQPCFPVKVAFGHVEQLFEKGVDYIFIPSIVSMFHEYSGSNASKLCPYVQSFAYQIRTSFSDKDAGTKILTVPMRFGEGRRLLNKSFQDVGKILDIDSNQVLKAVRSGLKTQSEFERSIKAKGKEILENLKQEEKIFVLVSRPYNGCDQGVNLRLCQKLADQGVRTIPMDMLDLSGVEITQKWLHDDVYWSYGQHILRCAEKIKKDPRLFGIYLSNFGCGPDSFLQTFFKEIMGGKPSLVLEIDEHSADAGLITRLEAFFESLKHYKKQAQPGAIVKPGKSKNIESKCSKQKLYIPYMSDCSYGIASGIRAYGVDSRVIPIADESTLGLGRKFTSGKECLPCAVTIGEMLRLIKSDGFNEKEAAFFMPKASGPCRFGMYNCMQKLVLKYSSNENAAVISPNQDSSFYKELCGSFKNFQKKGFVKDVWCSTAGVDLLGKLLLRLRPFARDTGYADMVYKRSLKKWLEAVEKRASFTNKMEIMESIAEDFSFMNFDPDLCKARVGIVGEIYVRNHPFSNRQIVRKLESLGLVCDLASLAEWIYYTNYTRMAKLRRQRRYAELLVEWLRDSYQRRVERRVAEPLERRFGKLAENDITETIELAKSYIHESFEGEAILSIGKTIEYFHNGIGGVVNVMPFNCMPSTIVSSQTMRISKECDDMPILNISFDGQDDASFETKLEAFVEQVRSRSSYKLALFGNGWF